MVKILKSILIPLILFTCASAHASQATVPTVTYSYEDGRACYKRITTDSKVRQERTAWRECIGIFAGVAESRPSSTDAPKATYSAARLSRELYGHKRKKSDLIDSLQYYNRVVADYPNSRLADDALYQIAAIRAYQMNEPERAKKALRTLIKRYPRGDHVQSAKSMLSSLESGKDDRTKAAKAPRAAEAERVEEVELIYTRSDETERPARSASSDEAGRISSIPYSNEPASSKNPAVLVDITHSKHRDSSSVTIHFDRPIAFKAVFEGGERSAYKTPSLDMMFKETHPRIGLKEKINVNSSTLRQIRVKPRILGGTKVNFTLKKGTDYGIKQGFRTVDINFRKGRKDDAQVASGKSKVNYSTPVGETYEAPRKKSKFSFAKLMPWKRKNSGPQPVRIIVDPGHGGDENGAVGPHGIMEKDVVLEISEMLAERLRNDLGAKVWLTRRKDRDVSLKKRYKYAKKKKADLFISVHANASTNPKHNGVETYYLNNATDEAAIKLAQRENQSWKGPKSDIDAILATMLQNAVTDESRVLAATVHKSVIGNLKGRYKGVRDRNVRSALFYVLVGTECPSILVETSFITNPKEEMRLADPTYQQQVASSITEGVRKYMSTRQGTLTSL